MMQRPLLFLSFPVIAYAGFSYGSNLIWFNVLNGTASLILGSAPYNFSTSMVGLSYVSPLLGVAAGSFYSGVVGDKITLWLARRNKVSQRSLQTCCRSMLSEYDRAFLNQNIGYGYSLSLCS